MKTIPVNRVEAPMTNKQKDAIIRDPNTINLAGAITSKQRIKNRKTAGIMRKIHKNYLDHLPKLAAGLLLLAGIFIAIHNIANAQKELPEPPREKDALEQLFEEAPEIKEIIEREEEQAAIIKYEEENPRPTRKEVMEKAEEIHQEKYQDQFEQELFKYISESEGTFQPNAFCDSYYRVNGRLIRETGSYCDRWSIGFGTLSYWGETITLEEGERRRDEDIRHRNGLIKTDCLTKNQRIATVDFMYQHGNNSSGVKNYANQCNSNAIYNQIVWWRDAYKGKFKVNGKYLTSHGLAKREQLRINLFFTK